MAPTPDAEGHGYRKQVPAHLWEEAVLVDDPRERKDSPRVFVRIPLSEELDDPDDPGHWSVGLYLPDRLTPSFDGLTLSTPELVAAYAPHPDSWVWNFVPPSSGGRATAQPLLIEKMKRRFTDGEGADHRPDEFEFLAQWVSEASGVPQQKGWPVTARRTVDGMSALAEQYAALHAKP